MPEWRVPGYTELKRLGSGGFGEVFLARHDASGTLVAIKYLRHDLLAETEFAEMFRTEAAVLASLDDPHVVRLYEYVESSSGAAIVMELVAGVSLREVLTFQGKTTAEAALTVLHGSLAGLATAHRRGIVHRDYKPENVLVDGNGASKLTDFGIAARTGSSAIPAGTLAYAAPEQMSGGLATPASDIYAATATFYECLTGRPPFIGEPGDLLRQHRSEPVPLDPVPEPLRPLVAAGMAKDTAQRPTDAVSFVAQLTAAATSAYGRRWHERGRSHLGEAALLLAALWPSGPPPTVQGTAVHQTTLGRRLKLGHVTAVKAAVAAGTVITVAAAGTALAVTRGSPAPAVTNHPAAAVKQVSLHPTSPPAGPTQLPAQSTMPLTGSTSPQTGSTSPQAGSVSPSIGSASPQTGSGQSQLEPTGHPTGPPKVGGPSPQPVKPSASVCESDGTGCTKAGTYAGPNALISSDYTGFKVVWTESVVQPYSSGVPLYWSAYITYTNVSSASLQLGCPGDWADASYVAEHMSGGDGDDGMVSAGSTSCSEDPGLDVTVQPGHTYTFLATFHNVPWPGSAVAIQWGNAGTSASVYPFS
jgi:eukaryotic-like serine/threonine-protein kinase